LRVKNDDYHKIDVPLTVQCDTVFYIMLAYKDRKHGGPDGKKGKEGKKEVTEKH